MQLPNGMAPGADHFMLFIADVTDPLGDVMRFIGSYDERFGANHPVFYQGTYSQVWYLDIILLAGIGITFLSMCQMAPSILFQWDISNFNGPFDNLNAPKGRK